MGSEFSRQMAGLHLAGPAISLYFSTRYKSAHYPHIISVLSAYYQHIIRTLSAHYQHIIRNLSAHIQHTIVA